MKDLSPHTKQIEKWTKAKTRIYFFICFWSCYIIDLLMFWSGERSCKDIYLRMLQTLIGTL
jgi:hypothetical protein